MNFVISGFRPYPLKHRRIPSIFRSVIFFIALTLFATACSTSETHACGAQVSATNRPLPDFQGTLLDTSAFDTAEWRTGTLLINVWGSWCAPCIREAPHLAQTANSMAEENVRFLGVDIKDNRPAAQQFEERYSIPYPSVFDDAGAFAAGLRVIAPPTTFLVQDGTVRTVIMGETDSSTIACVVRQISPPPPAKDPL